MSWVTVGVAAAGAIKGMMDSKAAEGKAAEHDKFRKAALENSPWTGMGDPGAAQVGNTNMASGALGGGLQGAMVGSMFAGGGGADAAPAVTGPQGGPTIANAQAMQGPMMQNQSPYMQRSPWLRG